MHEYAVIAPLLVAHLADRLQKRQRLDIADRAADFHDDHVHVRRDLAHGSLDFIGHVRDHLHGLAQVIAAPLAGDDLLINAAGSQIIRLRELGVREAFVMTEIEIGLGAVIGDEDLAMLERAHGAGVHVQVWIEFLESHS